MKYIPSVLVACLCCFGSQLVAEAPLTATYNPLLPVLIKQAEVVEKRLEMIRGYIDRYKQYLDSPADGLYCLQLIELEKELGYELAYIYKSIYAPVPTYPSGLINKQ